MEMFENLHLIAKEIYAFVSDVNKVIIIPQEISKKVHSAEPYS